MQNYKKVSIIVPVYNEKETILEILKKVEDVRLDLAKELIIVDDGSTDGTPEVLNGLDKTQYKVILKGKNEGKGAAIKAGIAAASGDFVIFQDADLEYDPKDYPALLRPLEKGEADMVIGSRVLSGSIRLFGPQRVRFLTYFGCKLIAFSINLLYGKTGTDYYGCYKAIRLDALKNIKVEANRFEYDSELLCKLLRRGVKTVEVPTAYQPRGYGAGKKLRWHDGFAVIFSIIKWRFRDS